ncbi:hypothetical protein EZV73_15375 [Acidaminobacter sp. JC074]|uniref:hypothetical protein n=1 Tax=Acidaminobacter sp. JC074 TaxID=2530199 RepID=UPI001F0FC8ED|nr:hypothetical protein [Acidaminobacter sp. JC074]MCH4888974.1 hypothetical protein [Acidaminobacter sp. JC074]
MKKKKQILIVLLLVLTVASSYWMIDYQEDKEAFDEIQMFLGMSFRYCRNYIVGQSFNDSIDYKLESAKGYSRLLGHLDMISADNRFIDVETHVAYIGILDDLEVLFEKDLDQDKLDKKADDIIAYLTDLEELCDAYQNTDMPMKEYLNAQKTLIASYHFYLKQVDVSDMNYENVLKDHPDYMSFLNVKVDQELLREKLFSYFDALYDHVEKDDIKIHEEVSMHHFVGSIDSIQFSYKDSEGYMYGDGSILQMQNDVKERKTALISEADKESIKKEVKTYLEKIGYSEYQYLELEDYDGMCYVHAYRSDHKRSSFDDFTFYYVKNSDIELQMVSFPLPIIKDIYDHVDYEDYYNNRTILEKDLKAYKIKDACFKLRESDNVIDYFWDFVVVIGDDDYEISFDAKTLEFLGIYKLRE